MQPSESTKLILKFLNYYTKLFGQMAHLKFDYQLHFRRTFIFSVQLEMAPKKDFCYDYQVTADH